MRILINLLRFDPDINIGGNYSYAFNMINSLAKIQANEYILLVTNTNKIMFQFDLPNVKYIVSKLDKNIGIRIVQENLIIKKYAIGDVADVYFSPTTLLPFLSIKLPSVCTIHDLNFKHFSQGILKNIYKNLLYRRTLKSSNYITTVSEFTKNDVLKNYSISSDKIVVVYNACNFKLKDISIEQSDIVREKYKIKSKYIMIVSHYRHKNAFLAMDSFKEAKDKLNEKYKMVIVGAREDLLEELQQYSKKINIYEDIIFIKYVEKADMIYMYYNASLFLFPSLFEGFGIPILEALQVKCPVIASNCAAIPEVAGDAIPVLNVNDKKHWADTIIKILNDIDYRKEIVDKGYNRSKKFNWDYSADFLNNIFIKLNWRK